MSEFQVTVDVIEKSLRVTALVVGGSWAYLKYVRGRTFHKRLEPKLEVQIRQSKESFYLVARATVKNVGLSKVAVEPAGTCLRLLTARCDSDIFELSELQWQHLATIPMLSQHAWIEPGELVEDVEMLALPTGEQTAIRGELFVVSDDTEWSAKDFSLADS